MTPEFAAAPLSGGLVGFSLGLVGGGGSILATPLLLYLVGLEPHIAIGTSALAVSTNAFANLLGHARSGNVRWRCAGIFAVIGALGAFAGSTLGKMVDGEHLIFLFGLLMLAGGATMLWPRRQTASIERPADVATCTVTGAVAFAAGLASGFFGIGGGFLIVPGLMYAAHMPILAAVSSSLLAVTAFSLTAALNYARSGWVEWPLAAAFAIGGAAGGLAGASLARRLAVRHGALNLLFAVLLFLVAFYMLYRGRHEFGWA
jgi:hypothetical protein